MFRLSQCHGPSSKDPTAAATDVAAIAENGTDARAGAALSYSDGDTVYVDTNSLRMRDQPSGLGAVVGSLKRSQEVKIVKRSGEWPQVVQGLALAWIAAQHVTSNEPAAPVNANSLSPPAQGTGRRERASAGPRRIY